MVLVLPFSCIQIGYGRNIRTFLEVQQCVLFVGKLYMHLGGFGSTISH